MKHFKDTYLGKLRTSVGSQLLQVPGSRIVIENNDSILLQKRSDFDIWGLPAGSPENYESIEDSIIRETKEETGLTIINLNVFGFASNPDNEIIEYPNGDVIQNFSLLFFTNNFSGELQIDNIETLDLRWFRSDDLPEIIKNHRITIEAYKKYKLSGKFQMI